MSQKPVAGPSLAQATTVAKGAAETTSEGIEKLLSQCSLEDDGIDWVVRTPPARKKVTETTGDQKKKLMRIFNQCFSREAIIGQRVIFDPNEVLEICRLVWPYLYSEPSYIEDITPPITIVGDLHGQLFDLDRVFKCRSRGGKPGWLCDKYLFLGDYVDRGRQSMEVVMGLFILKILYPDNFFLLRGNHEFMSINIQFGFSVECKERFTPKAAEQVFAHVNGVFSFLSICAKVGGVAFCVHGGVSSANFTTGSLRRLRKPLISDMDSILVHDLVWSDPAEGLQSTCFNSGRLTSIYYGERYFAYCMYNIDCLYMFRGHSVIDRGFEATWGRCFTVFSCSTMNLKRNKGAFVMMDGRMKMSVGLLPIDEDRLKIETEMKRRRTARDEEEVTQSCDEPEVGIKVIKT